MPVARADVRIVATGLGDTRQPAGHAAGDHRVGVVPEAAVRSLEPDDGAAGLQDRPARDGDPHPRRREQPEHRELRVGQIGRGSRVVPESAGLLSLEQEVGAVLRPVAMSFVVLRGLRVESFNSRNRESRDGAIIPWDLAAGGTPREAGQADR